MRFTASMQPLQCWARGACRPPCTIYHLLELSTLPVVRDLAEDISQGLVCSVPCPGRGHAGCLPPALEPNSPWDRGHMGCLRKPAPLRARVWRSHQGCHPPAPLPARGGCCRLHQLWWWREDLAPAVQQRPNGTVGYNGSGET